MALPVLGHQHPGPTPHPSTGSPRTPQSTASALVGRALLRAQLPEAPGTAVSASEPVPSADPLLRGHILSCLTGQEATHFLLKGETVLILPHDPRWESASPNHKLRIPHCSPEKAQNKALFQNSSLTVIWKICLLCLLAPVYTPDSKLASSPGLSTPSRLHLPPNSQRRTFPMAS